MNVKRLVLLVLLAVIMLVSPVSAAPTVYLDGQQLSFQVPPIIGNGRTLVPLRAIFEPLGATVQWNESTQTVTATKGSTNISLTLGQTTAYVNNQPVILSVPAKTINDRTMVPLRFVGEALGAQVNWAEATETITILSGVGPAASSQTTVHFIDVGQGDSIYIQLANHNDILIDGGNVTDGPMLVSYLKKQGVDDIELMIATHPHEDHIGGLPDVFDAFNIEKVIDSGTTQNTSICATYSSKLKAEGCAYEVNNKQQFTWGNTVLKVLTVYRPNLDWNNVSVVAQLDTGDIEFLFTGDVGNLAEPLLQGDISSDILKVGHHGSYTSSTISFLQRVASKVDIISVGAVNMYGHPAPTTLRRLQAQGATIYRTDLNGNIVVSTNGYTYTITTTKNLPAPVLPVVTPLPQPSGYTGIYVGSKNSNKYHYPDCSGAKQIRSYNLITFASKVEATAAGYVPCAICKP